MVFTPYPRFCRKVLTKEGLLVKYSEIRSWGNSFQFSVFSPQLSALGDGQQGSLRLGQRPLDTSILKELRKNLGGALREASAADGQISKLPQSQLYFPARHKAKSKGFVGNWLASALDQPFLRNSEMSSMAPTMLSLKISRSAAGTQYSRCSELPTVCTW
jgi:hypothetical protein